MAYPFVDVLRAWRKRAYGLEMPAPSGWHLPMSQEEFNHQCREAVEARWLFEIGQPIPGTTEGIQVLREAGHTIHFVTARTKEQFGGNTYDNTPAVAQALEPTLRVVGLHPRQGVHPHRHLRRRQHQQREALLAAGIDAWLMYDPPRTDQLGHPRLVMGWADFVIKVDELNQRFANLCRRGGPRCLTLGLVEAVQNYETFMDDHEVAAHQAGTTDDRKVGLVVVQDVHSLCRRANSSE